MSAPKNSKMNDKIVSSNPPSRAVGKDGSYYECIICNTEGELLCCETCPNTFHIGCLTPPLKSVPKGDWHCASCLKNAALKTHRHRWLIRKSTFSKQDSPAAKLHPLDEALFDDEEQNDVNLKGDAKGSKTTSAGTDSRFIRGGRDQRSRKQKMGYPDFNFRIIS